MRKPFHQTMSILAICLLFSQAFFGSLPVFAETNSNTQSVLTITMTENGQPYVEGDIAISPVTIQVAATSQDSAGIELSQDLGETWQPFDTTTSLVIEDVGDHDIWFKVIDPIGNALIEKRNIQISPTGGNGTSLAKAIKGLQGVQATANGTADGTYDFGGIVGANDSAGPGFATFSDKFVVSNGFQVDGTKLKATAQQFPNNVGRLVIKAEGTTTSKVFDLRSLGLSTDEVGGATLEYIRIESFHANKSPGQFLEIRPIFLFNNTMQLNQYFQELFLNISELVITWKLKDALDPSKLNFENIAIANVNPHVPPIISSSSSSNISFTEATVHSNVLSEGDATVTERGFVFAKGRIPTLNDNKVIVPGTTGPFQATLSGLSPNTVYYYRAYATSSVGTVFDNGLYKYFRTLGVRVFYNGNGETTGVVPWENQVYAPRDSVSVRGNTGNLVKTGYAFMGWNTKADGSGSSYSPNAAFIMGSSDVTLYAQWAIATYTVTYNGNGETTGIVPIDQQTYASGDSVNVEGNTGNIEKTGYTFMGWNTKADGSGTRYTENATFNMGSSNVMLYAHWEAIPTYSVTYDENGATSGTVPLDYQTYASGAGVTVAGNTGTLEKPGYTFMGWNTKADGSGTRYTENATFNMGSSNVMLYAHWAVIPTNLTYTVTYDGNGATSGTVPIDHNMYTTGDTVRVEGNTGNIEKPGHTFMGWNTQPNGKGKSYTENDSINFLSSNMTLFAIWSVNSYMLSFETKGGNAIANQIILFEQLAIAPSVPTKAGYTFAGWYKDTALTKAWDFKKDTVTASTTLYAKWVENSYSGGYIPNQVSYLLTFESNGGGKVSTRSIPYNDKSTEPEAPTKAGYTFAGWYKDAALTKAWDFTKDSLTEHTTLYAKWIANSTADDGDNIPIPTPIEPVPTPEVPQKPEEATSNYRFIDISSNWAKDMIEDIAARGIITGYPDGSFRPNEPIKREHVAVMFARAFELTAQREAVSFSDVPTSHPYYEAITRLQQAGVIDGSNGAFNPSESLTRAQLAKILVLAFGVTPGGTSTFQDVPKTHWSYDYIAALADVGIALGDNGNFRSDEPVTRAQFVAFMYRALNL